MRMAVVMDPFDSIRPDHDTTYVLMREADRRGHNVWHVGPGGVGYGTRATQLLGRLVRSGGPPAEPLTTDAEAELTGQDLDAVLIRTDPPFNADYLAVTQLLDLLPRGVFVMNSPAGLRDANEKLAALHFPELCPRTCISQSPARLDEFRREVGGAVVIKPLDGHGGRGVRLVRDDDGERTALLNEITRGGTMKALAQEVVAGAERGDKRIILLDGKPLGAVLRLNTSGGFVHNLAAGGEARPARLDPSDLDLCNRLGPWLREKGLWLAGIDVIGGKLIEINVTSPTCVQEINRFDGVSLEKTIIDFIEARVTALRNASVP